jgi:hypothetical protein
MTDYPPIYGPQPPISPYLATLENTRRFAKYDPADGFLLEYGTVAVGFFDDWIADSVAVVEDTGPQLIGLETHMVDLGTLQLREMTPEEVQARKDKYAPPASAMSAMMADYITTNQIVAALDARDHGDHSQWDALVARAKPAADDAR